MTRPTPERDADATHHVLADMLCRQEFTQLMIADTRLALIDLHRLSRQLAGPETEKNLTSLLSTQEQKLFSGFSYRKRRLEWLGGRLAAKFALGQLLGQDDISLYNAVAILPDGNGKPVVAFSSVTSPGAGVSLSHSGDYAVALACKDGRCGVDIQYCSAQLERVRERFAAEAELRLLKESHDSLKSLAILWTVKEAMKKCFLAHESTFFGKLRVVAAEKWDEKQWAVQCRIGRRASTATVHVFLFDHYSLAWVHGGIDA